MASTITVPSKSQSLIVFFLLAYGISWAAWLPGTLASYGLISIKFDSTLSSLLGAFGPFSAGLITTAIYDGRAGFSALVRRMLTWRVGIQWYLFVLLWPVVLSLAKTGIGVATGSTAPNFSQPPFVRLYPLPAELANSVPFVVFLPFVFLQQTLVGSSMGEEPGWRGYALPRLQAHRSSLSASLLLGFLWGLWHFPLWLTKGNSILGTFLGWSMLGLMATTVMFTWIYNHTRGSLLLALLFHTSIAITGLFLASADTHPIVDAALSWGAALLVIAVFGPTRLARQATGA
jgi:membrane protease YdiL (CAAX protease family)